jgi:hypothetical protein
MEQLNVRGSEFGPVMDEASMLLLAMQANTDAGQRVRAEMIAIIKAWQCGRLLPRVEAPLLQTLYGRAKYGVDLK